MEQLRVCGADIEVAIYKRRHVILATVARNQARLVQGDFYLNNPRSLSLYRRLHRRQTEGHREGEGARRTGQLRRRRRNGSRRVLVWKLETAPLFVLLIGPYQRPFQLLVRRYTILLGSQNGTGRRTFRLSYESSFKGQYVRYVVDWCCLEVDIGVVGAQQGCALMGLALQFQ